MADHVIERATPRVAPLDRYSPAMLLSLAFAFGILAQYLFYRSALGINVGIASLVILAIAWRLRPNGARVDPLDRWIVPAAIGRALLAAAFAWVAGGLFIVAGRRTDTTIPAVLPRLRGLLSSTAGATTLLAIDALFVFFVGLQIAYLFGGIDTLNATGLTYSSYARRGFFELIAVAVLAGGLLFAVELVVAKRSRVYVGAALTLTLATLVIVVSAAYRMHLYQLAYGWTEQRFYAFAGIAWLGAGGMCAAVLVWRDATRWLLHAAGLVGLAVAVAINLAGPSAFVARRDLERVIDPSGLPTDAYRGLDAFYLATLGDGAVPTLVEFLPRLGASDRAALGSALRTFQLEGRDLAPTSVPALNLDRERARQALLTIADELRGYPPFPGGRFSPRP